MKNFNQHVDNTISKINKGIICNKKTSSQFATDIINHSIQSLFRPLVDYGDIIDEQPQNESFCKSLQSIRYKAALPITVAVQGTSREKNYQELGLVSVISVSVACSKE